MLKKKDHVKNYLCYINSRHKNIKFTCDEENENKISFLDVTITRDEDALIKTIFQKETFSSVYLNFEKLFI